MCCHDKTVTYPDPEIVELRWLRPDGGKAMSVEMQYATADEAMAAVAACLDAFEEVRREGARPYVARRNSSVESDG